MLKKILIAVAIIIALPLIIALFTKKDYSLEREIVIAKPKQEVFNYIKLLKNQDHYSKWVMMDPNSRKTYKGTDGEAGFSAAWDSDNKNVGQGVQTISKIAEGERIDLDLQFIKPFDGQAKAYMITESVSETQTKVRWGFSSSMKYPLNFILLVMSMEKMLGADLSEGLGNLKKELEK
jgi:uncharacterized protein YndB with AHSA1/START domain